MRKRALAAILCLDFMEVILDWSFMVGISGSGNLYGL